MTQMQKLVLQEALPELIQTYRGLDIRVLGLHDGTGDETISLVAIIYATRMPPEDIGQKHRVLLNRLGDPSGDRVRLLLESRSIDELDGIFDQIESGSLTITGRHLATQTRNLSIRQQSVVEGVQLGIAQEDDQFGMLCVSLHGETSEDTPISILRRAQISPLTLKLHDWSELDRWLGAALMDRTYKLVFAFPIYVSIRDPLSVQGTTIYANLTIHRLLAKVCEYQARRYFEWHRDLLERKTLTIREESGGDDLVHCEFTVTFDQLHPRNEVLMEVYHPRLGVVSSAGKSIASVLQPLDEPLWGSFRKFAAVAELRKCLLAPHGGRADLQLSSGMSWLLELCGFHVIHLSTVPNAESLKIESKIEGSADILAYDVDSSCLVLIDCTTSSPSLEKWTKIRLTAEELFKATQVLSRPLLVTSKMVPELKDEWSTKHKAKLWDLDNLKTLVELCEAGELGQAKRAMLSLVGAYA